MVPDSDKLTIYFDAFFYNLRWMIKNTSPAINNFCFKQTSYLNWLREFATVLGCQVKSNSISFAEADKGKGTSAAYMLEKGLTACVNNYLFKDEFHFTRQPSDNFGVIIYLYHFQTVGPIHYKLDDLSVLLDNGSHFELRITNAQTLQHLKFGNTTLIRGISIYLENEWITKNLSNRILEVFDYLQEVNYFKQFINAKQQRLMNEILNVQVNHPYREVYIRSRILRILDKLFENLLQRDISESPEKMSLDDFATLQKIEAILSKSYEEAFPGIEKLSRLSLMSESKLKKLFKQSFGLGLYEYFQKNRMHMAREQIVSGKFSISQTGTKLGYQNLSNFSKAFRKEFNCLPSQVKIRP